MIEFAKMLNRMISAGLGGDTVAPSTEVAVGYTTEWRTISDYLAVWYDKVGNLPLRSLIADIDIHQDLHGYDAPWPGGCGKNLANISFVSPFVVNGITYTLNANGTITADGENNTAYQAIVSGPDFSLESGSYILSGAGSSNITIQLVKVEGESVSQIAYVSGIDSETSVTVDSDITARIRIFVGSGKTVSDVTVSPMLRLSSVSDATFAPYSNICPITGYTGLTIHHYGVVETIFTPISWETEAGTIYHGTLDVTTGVLTVKNVSHTITSIETASPGSGNYGSRFYVRGYDPADTSNFTTNQKSNYLKVSEWATTNNSFYVSNVGTIYILLGNTSDSMTVDQANEYLTTNPLQVCYELAEPQTYQLDPTEIISFKGQNYLETDMGKVTLVWKDIQFTEGY